MSHSHLDQLWFCFFESAVAKILCYVTIQQQTLYHSQLVSTAHPKQGRTQSEHGQILVQGQACPHEV